MRIPSVKRYLSATLLTPALLSLQGCASAPEPKFIEVEVPVPVRAPLDPRLLADCNPTVPLPETGPLTVGHALDRLAAVENAIFLCRTQLEKLRQLDATQPTGGPSQ